MSDSDYNEGVHLITPATRLKTFAAGEMVACGVCSRANPPNRAQCLYCGGNLPVVLSEDPGSIPIAEDEAPGQTLLLSSDQFGKVTDEIVAKLALIVGISREELSAAVLAGGALPLAATDNSTQEARLTSQIESLGLEPSQVPPEDLSLGSRKVRGLDITSDFVRALGTASEKQSHDWKEITLIVMGRIVTTRIEVDEKRRGGKTKALDARQFSSDQMLMDIYFKAGEAWRVYADDFDYSCLGERKAMTGFENFGRLLDLMREHAPAAEIDNSYARKRALLANVWPLDEASRRTVAFARDRKHQQSTTTSNESQFNQYSRAAYLLRTRSEATAQ